LYFLRATRNPDYGHKGSMKTPDFTDRLSAASTAKKAQLERPGQLRKTRKGPTD
jgi:hypothetical protein